MMRYMLLMCGEVEAAEPDVTPVPTQGPAPAPAHAAGDADEPCWMPWAREMAARGVILHDGTELTLSRTYRRNLPGLAGEL